MPAFDRTPHEKRRGWLRNGNPPGDLSKAPRCEAKTRRGTGLPLSGDEERTLSIARWPEHGSQDPGGHRAHPTRRHEARPLLAGRQGRTSAPVAATEGLPGGADVATRLTDHPVEWCGRCRPYWRARARRLVRELRAAIDVLDALGI